MTELDSKKSQKMSTDNFLKTVSAYANGDGGVICLKIAHHQTPQTIHIIKKAYMYIEHHMMNSITPQPEYSIELEEDHTVIKLIVEAGQEKPYLYESKAYKMIDNRIVEVNKEEVI